MRTGKIILGIASAGVIGAAGFLMTAFMGGATAYSTASVETQSIAERVEATGDVHGENRTTYYSSITAPIDFFTMSVGDTVKKGSKVVGYDMTDLERAREQAELSALSAENTMNGQVTASNSNAAKYKQAKDDVEIYKYTYALYRQAGDALDQSQYQENWDINCAASGIQKDIAKKTGEINAKNVELEKAKMEGNNKRAKQLIDEIESLNNDVAKLNADYAGLPPANLNPEEYARQIANGNWMSDAMRNWTEAATLRNTYENQILNSYQKDQLQNMYDISLLNVETADEDLAEADRGVHIDFDGVVTECFVDCGSVVGQGSPLFTVESSENMKVDVGISKYDIGKIKIGQKAEIALAGNTYTGSVTEIKHLAQSGDSDKAKVTVSVRFDRPDENVFLGLEADVTIFTTEKSNVLTIPLEAYYVDDGGTYCYVIRNGIVEKQYITTGVESADYVEVMMGLKSGDVVITDAVTDDQVGTKAEAKQ
ncbi:MAG: efflux RND transporter periplasmic adaptor subunit [Lachnospiraceae bacterium]|nr:efflux RND transporter periplasmic adaptor subunit [Lachnospiraceae bacterium]